MTPRRGLIWPLLLIAIGVVFLLANFGLIAPFSAAALFRLWPLVLIFVGIDIALGRRWPYAALALQALVLAAGIGLVALEPVYPGWVAFSDAGSARGPGQSQVSVPRGTTEAMTVHLNGGAGTFNVSGGKTTALVEATSDHEDLTLRSTGSADRPDVRIDQNGDPGLRFGPASPVNVVVRIASDVSTSFAMNAGAGEFVVDLRDVKLTDARLNVGAASLRIVLPKATGDVSISISAGASSVVIEIPDGVEARVNASGALMSVRSENPRVAGSETSGYSGAKDRVTVRVTAGASSIVIR